MPPERQFLWGIVRYLWGGLDVTPDIFVEKDARKKTKYTWAMGRVITFLASRAVCVYHLTFCLSQLHSLCYPKASQMLDKLRNRSAYMSALSLTQRYPVFLLNNISRVVPIPGGVAGVPSICLLCGWSWLMISLFSYGSSDSSLDLAELTQLLFRKNIRNFREAGA